MEEHRLLPMQDNYDKNLFNKLYKETEPLRKKLSSKYSIDARIFGVDQKEILSWFDVKFIFVFNKHFNNKDPGVLKGFIINSLKTFKYRILRSSQTNKNQQYANVIDIEESSHFDNIISNNQEKQDENKQIFLDLALAFMKSKLSEDASFLLEIELDPPLYIMQKLCNEKKSLNTKIPSKLIAEYLDLQDDNNAVDYINELRREIREMTLVAREHFQSHQELLPEVAISY